MRQLFLAISSLAILCGAMAAASADGLGRPEQVDLGEVSVTDGRSARSLEAVVPEGPAIIHLWATWCGPCREELPALADFAAALADRDMSHRLVLVSVDRGRFGKVKEFLDELGLPELGSWQEAGRSAGTVFRIAGYPSTLVLDAEHRLVVRHAGPLEWDDKAAQDRLAAFLSE